MASTTLYLPHDRKALSETLLYLLEEARQARVPYAVEWYLAFHYLRGARYFEQIDYERGFVKASYKDEAGEYPFKYESLLPRFQSEVSRLVRLDVRPVARTDGLGLLQTRKAATAHVVLDTLMRSIDLDALKLEAAQMLCMYGTVGATNWVISEPGIGDEDSEAEEVGLTQLTSNIHSIELVPPWELLPIPAEPMTRGRVAAICRERWVMLDWLLQQVADTGEELDLGLRRRGGREGASPYPEDLGVVHAPPLYSPNDASPMMESLAPSPPPSNRPEFNVQEPTSDSSEPGKADRRKIAQPHVLLREIWVRSPSGRLGRYIIMVGQRVVFDRDFMGLLEGVPRRGPGRPPKEEAEARKRQVRGKPLSLPPLPIAVAQYHGGTGFFGRSFLAPLIPLNAEVEAMLYQWFRNVEDADAFGYTFYPESWGIPKDTFEEAKPGRRFIPYSVDPNEPDLKPFTVAPSNTGDWPARVMEMSMQLLDKLAQQPQELLSGQVPGRLESAKGLDVLFQASTVPLGAPAMSMADMFVDIYSSILWHTKTKWKALRVNLLSLLDDTVIGIKFDPRTGVMRLDQNAVPDPAEVRLDIRSRDPLSPEQRKQDLLVMRNLGVISDQMFRILNRLYDLGWPTGNDVEWQNYIRAVINNILMFGDGVEPGEIFVSDYDIPSVHEYVVLRRIASPEFALASDAVKKKFSDRLRELRDLRGRYPEPLPLPEEGAAEALRASAEARGGPGAVPLTEAMPGTGQGSFGPGGPGGPGGSPTGLGPSIPLVPPELQQGE